MKSILLIFSLLSSLFLSSQELDHDGKKQIEKIKGSPKTYEGLSVSKFLDSIPDIKMLRIIPNFPLSSSSTFIFGFTDNKTFSKAEKKDRITIVVNASNLNNKNFPSYLFKEDIDKYDAKRKYGDLKVVQINQ
ncbi:hypothetical protein NAL32_21910 [Chryseobacterium sp. Ch-15]|uniref:Uncharacterized protein n=1 Tax=Chryseobacterium muglaense TaxID=2893752 RepID=A0A9Q3UYM1_9FLAO|nr:hypothetical protein [Chryseobacterium muglaense]MBD3905657.1 hypothetical protein [Chryseobacterium muglaense]MCC9036378.1 hypothetical protein [Chryseobacterium muglaense]MCM2557045.1 hypothetical protein [Chryseobacterium muglaense]